MSFPCHAESAKSNLGRLVSCRATIRPVPTVVNGKIVLEDVALEEGSVAAVLTRGANEPFMLTEAQEEELLEALAEIERGEFVSLEELLRTLPSNG